MQTYIKYLLLAAVLLSSGCSSGYLSRAEKKQWKSASSKNLSEAGQTAFNKGDYKRAIDLYRLILAKKTPEPEYAVQAEYEIGFSFYYMKDYKRAKLHFNRVLKQYSGSFAKTYHILAEKLLKKIAAGKTQSI